MLEEKGFVAGLEVAGYFIDPGGFEPFIKELDLVQQEITKGNLQDIPVEGVTIHRIPSFGSNDDMAVGPTIKRPLYDMFLAWKTG